ncbi:Gfo/Idh/MocA family oxidoreductase [Lederbergia sp. NSJ-179]|uniref:Gfo/Idh/MocA family protein n=1 Tax=Lederbergia sp. NSJ-179 TaxID=2931402 RepID=UPI001FD162BA|nr:Gfo/Idh/MocA family oxidoreductase [Lederbergia sp. NSJ-179]MCJ7840766.1 Gfo/Idh/MocA family oxidoreductase [Lederbergia sp. NSJ-179]
MKIAVIGSGKLGQRHLDKWQQIAGVEVVGVIARNRERLEMVAKKYDVKPFTSLEELFAQTDVDAVDVCTPTYTHAELVKQAAQAKKHVICEKPLALTSVEANEMIQVCEENQVQLLVGHTLRFFPEYANAKEQVEGGKIGKPGVVRLTRGVPFPQGRSWYADDEKSGGLFLDLGSHEFDWLQWTFGDVKRVMAKSVKRGHEEAEKMEYGFVTLRMEDGTIAYVELSWAEPEFQASYELAGDKGMITYDHQATVTISLQLHSSADEDRQVPKSLMHKDPYRRQLEHFIQCMEGKAEPIVTATDALKAIQIAEAAVKSIQTGQPVSLSEGGR